MATQQDGGHSKHAIRYDNNAEQTTSLKALSQLLQLPQEPCKLQQKWRAHADAPLSINEWRCRQAKKPIMKNNYCTITTGTIWADLRIPHCTRFLVLQSDL